jgi:hypothetical protein
MVSGILLAEYVTCFARIGSWSLASLLAEYVMCFARIGSWSLAFLLAEYVTCFARIGSWPLAFRAVASRPLKQILLVGKNGFSGTTYSSNDLGNLVKFPIPQVFILTQFPTDLVNLKK